jgi:hypothetical protein
VVLHRSAGPVGNYEMNNLRDRSLQQKVIKIIIILTTEESRRETQPTQKMLEAVTGGGKL